MNAAWSAEQIWSAVTKHAAGSNRLTPKGRHASAPHDRSRCNSCASIGFAKASTRTESFSYKHCGDTVQLFRKGGKSRNEAVI
jgi:hypothetical protein